MITALERLSGLLSALFIAVASVFLVLMALVGAADVVSFNLFGVPVPAANEIASAMLPIVVMLAMSHAQRQRAHIRVDILSSHFPPPLARAADGLAALAGLAVFILLAIGAWELAMKSVAISERAIAAVRFPVWPAKLVFAAGATAVGVELLAQLARAFVPDRTAPEPRQ